MKRAEVFKLAPTWLIAQADGKFWFADVQDGARSRHARFATHAEALAHALDAVGLDPTDRITRTYRDHYAKDQS